MYQGAGHNLLPPSAPGLLSPRSNAGGHGGSDENSVGESLEEGTEDKKKKLTKDQVKELETMFQSGYTGAPGEIVRYSLCLLRVGTGLRSEPGIS